jgi:hypothetical protein
MQPDKIEYYYPWSKSNGTFNVYYIGQSKNLRKCLTAHRKFYRETKSNPKFDFYWPYYGYAAYHGRNIAWAVTTEDLKDVERQGLIDFANSYGAKPVANAQSGWE